MKFNSSYSIEDDYFESEDYYVLIDEENGLIRLQNFLVRSSPIDDYRTLMDQEFSLAEFAQRDDLKELVRSWFGEITVETILTKIVELS